MKTLTDMELLFLCRCVSEDYDKMERRIERCRRYILRGEDRHKELALAEAERDAILSVKKKINNEIALREYTRNDNVS